MKNRGWKFWLKYSIEVVVFTPAFAALSIILTRFASINIGSTIRIGFGRLPIMMASVWLGPVFGALCGWIADFLGALMSTGWNPILSIPAVICGIIPFFLFLAFRVKNSVSGKKEIRLNVFKIGASVVITKVVTQGIIMTFLLAYVFKQTSEQIITSLLIRNIITIGEAIVESAVIYMIYTNKAINKILR